MEHGIDTGAVAVVAVCVLAWGLVSARFERVNVTAPIVFVVLGLVLANGPLALLDIDVRSSTLRGIAEITLALVLFVDASRVNVRGLLVDSAPPIRLLGIGLPLTIGAGFAAAVLLFNGVDLWVAAVIATVVAPTDAALGASIMQDERVPRRVRRLLNVESGLNDGIVTPFVSFFIAGATAAESAAHSDAVQEALVDLGLGVAIGIAVGVVGGVLLAFARRAGWSSPAFRPFAVFGLALASYALALEAGGNGFVAAFVGGLAFGSVRLAEPQRAVVFTDELGELLSLFVWFLFGAAIVVPAFDHVVWQDFVFALLALTVVRMVPVAIAAIGSGLDRSTVVFVGWFGPRGLATVVFALLAFDELLPPDGDRVLAAATVTVVLSVVLHGVTASPLTERYSAAVARDQTLPEHEDVAELPTRAIVGRRRRAR
jgi:sodium/hydrogen antiporter